MKIAAALRGKRKSKAHRLALGKPKSESHKRKLSEANLNPVLQAMRRQTMLEKYGVEHPKKLARLNNLRVEYWLERGLTRVEAKEKISQFQKLASSKRKSKTSIWRKDYWMKQGFSEAEAEAKVSEIQIINASKTNITVSQESKSFLDELEKELGIEIEREVTLLGRFMVDGFIPSKNLVLEYLGSFWHMHPGIFKPTDIHRVTGWTAQAKWNEDEGRVKRLKLAGYRVIDIWDVEVTKLKLKELARGIRKI